jgi:hypothetical protein
MFKAINSRVSLISNFSFVEGDVTIGLILYT